MNENAKDSRKEYLDERNLLVNAELEVSHSFDKAMITLSAGALGLSLTYMGSIVSSNPIAPIFLYFSWAAFTAALISIIFSFVFSLGALRKQREILDNEQEGGGTAKNCMAVITNIFNYVSVFMFSFGAIMLFIFAVKNFKK